MKITTKFCLWVILPVFAACIIIVCEALGSFVIIHWKLSTRDFLSQQLDSKMKSQTDSISKTIDIFFKESENNINTMYSYVQKSLTPTYPISQPYASYYGASPLTMVPVNDVSGYPMASVIYIAAAAGAATTSAYAQVYATSYVNISSLYDNAFRAIYKSSQILEQLYMGFENGLMRIYPYKSLEV